MKKFFLFLLIVIAAGALIFYFFIREKNDLNIWQLVPAHSSIVIESKYPLKTWNAFLESGIGKGYKETQMYAGTVNFISAIDSLSGIQGAAEKVLSESMVLSVIPTAQDQFEFLYILPVRSPETREILEKVNLSVVNEKSLDISSRTYQEMTINEIVSKGKVDFAFTVHENFLIVSRSSFLVESVIRLINGNYSNSFKEQNAKLFELPSLTSDAGNIYINFRQFGRLLKTFVEQSSQAFFDPVSQLNGGAAFDITISENAAVLNGFSISYDSTELLEGFKTQSPGRPEVFNYISGNTNFIWTYELSDVSGKLEDAEIITWAGGDMAYLEMASLHGPEPSPVLFVETKDPGKALNFLNLEAEKAAMEDTVYREYFAGYPLTELDRQEWPSKIFPNLYDPFKQCFFTMLNNYVVLSNDLEALKVIIEDVENENTWGKNIDIRKYLNLGLEESNINLVVQPEIMWVGLLEHLNPNWENEFSKNENFLKGFVLSNLQLSKVGAEYYTSFVLPYEPREILTSGSREIEERFIKKFDNPIATSAQVVKNHNSNQFEVIVQDEAHSISLLDWNGNILWTDSIGELINNDVAQIDFYNNDKLQYFFTGGNSLFLIDRNGDYVENYPIAIGEHDIQFASVVDYDNSKNYRFLLADGIGSVYMVDKHGNVLDGWTPKALQGELASKPFHVRVRARDYIVAVQKRGIIHVMNRRGEYYPGFPIDIGGRIGGDSYLQKGTNAENTSLTVVTEAGQLVKINMDSKILTRENLYRPTRETNFYLVPEAQNNRYLLVREGLTRVAVLDESGERMFEKDYLSVDPLNIQYYNFGTDKEVIAITDKEQQFSYLYNDKGNLLNAQPLNSAKPVALMYFSSTNEFHLLKVYKNMLTALSF